MKEWYQLKDYRRKYERFYGEPIPDGYDVHHIDTNRKNNSIINLIAVPKDVHRRYHKALTIFELSVMGGAGTTRVKDIFIPGMMTGACNMDKDAINEAVAATEELTYFTGMNAFKFFRRSQKWAEEFGVGYTDVVRM